MQRWTIRNLTPARLIVSVPPKSIQGLSAGRMELAPLERIVVEAGSGGPDHPFGEHAQQAREERCLGWELEPPPDVRGRWTAWLGVVVVVSLAALGIAVGSRLWLAVGLPALLVLVLCVYLIIYLSPARASQSWTELSSTVVATLVHTVFVGIFVFVAGVLAPLTAIYASTELASALDLTEWPPIREPGTPAGLVIVGRLLQIVLIGLLAVLPALMYLQFDREKMTTLVDRWLHNIFRLDATLTTVADVDAKFGRRVEEFYGVTLDTSRPRPDTRWRSRSAIVFATALIAIGWIIVLLKPGIAYTREVDLDQAQYLGDLFTPAPAAMTFAFLGAYLFTLQTVFRGYVRGDLRPKTYNNVTTRIIWAVVLAWVLETLVGLDHKELYVLAFFAGIVPDTVLRLIWDTAGRGYRLVEPGKRATRGNHASGDLDYPLEERAPLSELDGIDIYDRTRLSEEGITNIQALARHDFVDLMLSTRIPVARLIDWVDQALLYQHLSHQDRLHLHGYGIRTATELLHAAKSDVAQSDKTDNRREPLLKADSDGTRLRLISSALEDDEWLPFVVTWRRSKQQQPPPEKRFGPSALLGVGHGP
jgi:hypothetical protein